MRLRELARPPRPPRPARRGAAPARAGDEHRRGVERVLARRAPVDVGDGLPSTRSRCSALASGTHRRARSPTAPRAESRASVERGRRRTARRDRLRRRPAGISPPRASRARQRGLEASSIACSQVRLVATAPRAARRGATNESPTRTRASDVKEDGLAVALQVDVEAVARRRRSARRSASRAPRRSSSGAAPGRPRWPPPRRRSRSASAAGEQPAGEHVDRDVRRLQSRRRARDAPRLDRRDPVAALVVGGRSGRSRGSPRAATSSRSSPGGRSGRRGRPARSRSARRGPDRRAPSTHDAVDPDRVRVGRAATSSRARPRRAAPMREERPDRLRRGRAERLSHSVLHRRRVGPAQHDVELVGERPLGLGRRRGRSGDHPLARAAGRAPS